MGLTIHYSLRSDCPTAGEARQLVERIRERALVLPFAEVSYVLNSRGNDNLDGREPLFTLARQYVEVAGHLIRILPTFATAFSTVPAHGSEFASFGLCCYPSDVDVDGQRFTTGLTGWSWSSYCKTQYASNSRCGGLENFLRCHLSVVGLLDYCAVLGVLRSVADESGFYERRDVKTLATQVGEWNTSIAAFVGQLQEQYGHVIGEITRFPNFEHLEAKGQQTH